MCGIVGFVNIKQEFQKEEYKNVLSNMLNKIKKRGPDEDGMYLEKHVMLGHKRLIVIDPENGKQPMQCKFQNNTYTIVYNGQLYNTKELRSELEENGFTFNGHSDTEVLLKSYICFRQQCSKKIKWYFCICYLE